MEALIGGLVAILILVGVVVGMLYFTKDEEKEVEEVNELDIVNRPLADFRPTGETEEEFRIRVQRLEDAIILIEKAFGWKLIPDVGEEPVVSVVEKVEREYIAYIPAIIVEEPEPEQPKKPILPRFAG